MIFLLLSWLFISLLRVAENFETDALKAQIGA